MPHKKKKSKDSAGSSKSDKGSAKPQLKYMKKSYNDLKELYYKSPYAMHFKNIYTTRINPLQDVPIDNAICIGLGSLTSMPVSPMSHPLCSYTQLVAFESWVHCLIVEAEQESFDSETRLKHVYLQDPAFSELDKKFIQEELGFTVIEGEAAFAVITDRTFLFAPFPPMSIKYSILYAASPGILIGNKLGSVIPWSKFSDWCLSTKRVTSFYTSRNFATMASPDCMFRDEHRHTFAWLDEMILYYPAAKEEHRMLKVDLDHGESDTASIDSCVADIMTIYNSSNIELKNWYDKLPKNITFKEVLAVVTMHGKQSLIDLGPGMWTESYGFMFDPIFLSCQEKIKKDAQEKARRVEIEFRVVDELLKLSIADDADKSTPK